MKNLVANATYAAKIKSKLTAAELAVMPELAQVEIKYFPKLKASLQPKVTSSADAYNYLIKILEDKVYHVEHFAMLHLNRANFIIGWSIVSVGGLAGTVADPKVIFQLALLRNSSSIIVAHNHPSGNLKPSAADISLTKKLVDAGKFLDLPILDHLIITEDNYYSFADEGLI